MEIQDSGPPVRPYQDADAQTRASDADRDRTAGMINSALAEGRIDADEHAERLDAAYAARTWEQLRRLTADLPAGGAGCAPRPVARVEPSELERCLQCALMIACPPIGFTWWYLSRRRTPRPTGPTGHTLGTNRPALR